MRKIKSKVVILGAILILGIVLLGCGFYWKNRVSFTSEDTALGVMVTASNKKVLPEDTQVVVTPLKVTSSKAREEVAPVSGETVDERSYQALISEDISVLDVGSDGGDSNSEQSLDYASLLAIAEEAGGTQGGLCVPLDITLKKNDKEIQPAAQVAVRVAIPEEMAKESVRVYHIDDTGKATHMPGSVKGDTYEFKTTHFSVYTIYGTSRTTSATVLTSSSAGTTLSGGRVYTINDTAVTIRASSGAHGLRVNATSSTNPAVIFIPTGKRLYVYGGAGSGRTGGGAGIYLPNGHYLYIRGGGELYAYGGAGAASASGSSGLYDAYFNKGENVINGSSGGAGGYGGGGGGAGIGGGGGSGGASGGTTYYTRVYSDTGTARQDGNPGAAGGSGGGGGSIGELRVLDKMIVYGTGGAGGARGSYGGSTGNTKNDAGSGFKNDYSGGAGGGGGGGGYSGAGAGIGGGGGGAGAGGSGGAGGTYYNSSGYSYLNGGGGSGGVVGGFSGSGTKAYVGSYWGGSGGSGGTAGSGGYGGLIYKSTEASVTHTAGSGSGYGGNASTIYSSSYTSNSAYYITLNGNRPAGVSETVTSPSDFFVRYYQADTASRVPVLVGHTFQGYYNTTSTTSGTQVIKANGVFNATDARTYIDSSGHWIYFDDLTLYARWTKKVATVSFSKQGGTSGTSAVNATYGSAMPSITAPMRVGYTFDGYWDALTGTAKQYYSGAGESVRAWDKDVTSATLYARWIPKKSTITFDGNGGEISHASSVTATYAANMPAIPSFKAPTKKGYTFIGYYDSTGSDGSCYYKADGTSAKAWNKDVASATLFARWTINTYTITPPADIKEGGLSAYVAFAPGLSAEYQTTMTATLSLGKTGEKPEASGIHVVKYGIDGTRLEIVFSEYILRSNNPYAGKSGSSSFTLEDNITKDMSQLSHEFIPMPDLFNQSYVYDGRPKSYVLPIASEGTSTEVLGYDAASGSELTNGVPIKAGNYSVQIKVTPEGADAIIINKELEIRPKELTWNKSGLTALSKDYDSTTGAAITGSLAITGVAASDLGKVGLTAGVLTGTFDNALPGTAKLVTVDVSGVSLRDELGDGSIRNYTLPQTGPTLRANIYGLEPFVEFGLAKTAVYNGEVQKAMPSVGDFLVTFRDPVITSIVLNQVDEANIRYTYYTNENCSAMTTAADGIALGAADGSAPANAGTYYVCATFTPGDGQTHYEAITTGRETAVKYVITPGPLAENELQLSFTEITPSYVYSGLPYYPEAQVFLVKDGNKKLLAPDEYTLEYINNVNASSEEVKAGVKAVLKHNYRGESSLYDFQIERAIYQLDSIDFPKKSVDLEYNTFSQSGEAQLNLYELLKIDPLLKVSYRYQSRDGGGYDSDQPPAAAGQYTVTATVTTDNGNYRFPNPTPTYTTRVAELNINNVPVQIGFDPSGGSISGSEETLLWVDAARYMKLEDYPEAIPTPVKAGYELVGWTFEGITYGVGSIGKEEVRIIDQQDGVNIGRTYQAVWREAAVSVVFAGNGGSYGDGDEKTYSQPFGTEFEFSKIKIPERSGYQFLGWAISEEAAATGEVIGDDERTFTFESNTTYYASWEITEYPVTIFYNGGLADEVEKIELKIPYQVSVAEFLQNSFTAPTLQGHDLLNWINLNVDDAAAVSTEEMLETVIQAPAFFVAIWDGQVAEVAYSHHLDGTGEAKYQIPKTEGGISVAYPQVSGEAGKEFCCWKVVATGENNGFAVGTEFTQEQMETLKIKDDVTFEAEFATVTQQVVFEVNGATSQSGNLTQTVGYGNVPTLVEVSKTHYQLSGWLDVGTGIIHSQESIFAPEGAEERIPITKDTTYIAQWAPDTKTVTFNHMNGSAGAIEQGTSKELTLLKDEQLIIENVPEPLFDNYNFLGWATTKEKALAGEVDIPEDSRQTITEDVTWYAVWSQVKHTVVFKDQKGSPIQGAEYSIAHNTTLGDNQVSEVQPPEQAGERFVYWSISNAEQTINLETWQQVASYPITKDVGFTAVYEEVRYRLEFEAFPGVSGTGPSIQTRSYGTEVLLSEYRQPTPRMGYEFKYWADAPISKEKPEGGAPVTVHDFKTDLTVYAIYAKGEVEYELIHMQEASEYTSEDDRYAVNETEVKKGRLDELVDIVNEIRTYSGFTTDYTKTVYQTSGLLPGQWLDEPLSIQADGSLKIRIYYLRNTHPVIYQVANEDSIQGAPTYDKTQEHAYGTTVVVQGEPSVGGSPFKGYTFSGWQTTDDIYIKGSGGSEMQSFLMPDEQVAFSGMWQVNLGNIVFELNGGSGDFGDIECGSDTSVTLPTAVPTRESATFTGWLYKDTSGNEQVYEAGEQFVMPRIDPGEKVTLKATWTYVQGSLAFDLRGAVDEIGDFAPLVVGSEETVTLPLEEPVLADAAFAGWLDRDGRGKDGENGEPWLPGEIFTLPVLAEGETYTLIAKWEREDRSYRVYYDAEGIQDETPYQENDKVQITSQIPTKEGYAFVGWSDVAGNRFAPGAEFAMPKGDVNFRAVWFEENQVYKITYNTNGGSPEVIEEGLFYEAGTTATVTQTTPELAEYLFSGWLDPVSNTVYQSGASFLIGGQTELIAQWEKAPVPVVISYDTEGLGTPPIPENAVAGQRIVLPDIDVEKEGHVFTGWCEKVLEPIHAASVMARSEEPQGTIYAVGSSYVVPEYNVTFYPVWRTEGYTVKYVLDGGWLPENAPSGYIYGEYENGFSIPLPERPEYTFAGWYADASYALAKGRIEATDAENLVFYAKWDYTPTPVPTPETTPVPTPAPNASTSSGQVETTTQANGDVLNKVTITSDESPEKETGDKTDKLVLTLRLEGGLLKVWLTPAGQRLVEVSADKGYKLKTVAEEGKTLKQKSDGYYYLGEDAEGVVEVAFAKSSVSFSWHWLIYILCLVIGYLLHIIKNKVLVKIGDRRKSQ
ncbi:putative repeat protein (TIGR02543 family) [Lachnospiraceae bacterium PFB1-21]